MDKTPPMYTATMAKVLEEQGNYPEALSIYRRLVADNPNQPELVAALKRVNKHLGNNTEDQLVQLFEEWVELLCTQDRVSRLRHIDSYLDPQKR